MTRSTHARFAGAAVLGVLLSAAGPARAEQPSSSEAEQPQAQPRHVFHWDPAWSHRSADYTVAAVAGTIFAVEGLGFNWVQAPLRWTDPILFDADVRSALRATDQSARTAVDIASWTLLGAQLAYPVVVDVPYAWLRYGPRLAGDLFWQDAATLFVAGALDLALRDLTGRARPYVYDCLQQGRTEAECVDNPEAVRSFPGGHFLMATAASVLTCTQHLYVHLYGRGWDGMTCAMTLASDAAVGVMRIVADSHWATDQIAGAALGALVGWGVPFVMHYAMHSPPGREGTQPAALVVPTPIAFPSGGGLGVFGLF